MVAELFQRSTENTTSLRFGDLPVKVFCNCADSLIYMTHAACKVPCQLSVFTPTIT